MAGFAFFGFGRAWCSYAYVVKRFFDFVGVGLLGLTMAAPEHYSLRAVSASVVRRFIVCPFGSRVEQLPFPFLKGTPLRGRTDRVASGRYCCPSGRYMTARSPRSIGKCPGSPSQGLWSLSTRETLCRWSCRLQHNSDRAKKPANLPVQALAERERDQLERDKNIDRNE